MSRHLEEAIALNTERRPLYGEQDWRAYIVSTLLIWSEKWSLKFIAPKFDQAARVYQEHGIALLCDEFIEMSKAPQFVARTQNPPEIETYQPPNVKAVVSALRLAIESRSLNELQDASGFHLHLLESEPRFNCMTRHLLESVHRAAHLGPVHIQKAKEMGLPSPEDLIWDFITEHLNGIQYGVWTEKLAAQIQAKGIPIVCHDVPAIPSGKDELNAISWKK